METSRGAFTTAEAAFFDFARAFDVSEWGFVSKRMLLRAFYTSALARSLALVALVLTRRDRPRKRGRRREGTDMRATARDGFSRKV